MRVYVDTSVLLRVVLGERGVLREWRRITRPVASELIVLECVRTIDRARIRLQLPDAEVAERRAAVLERTDTFQMVPLDGQVLGRAADAFPTVLGTLEALHLASALVARSVYDDLVFATHDHELGVAARAMGFRVLGVGTPS